MLDSKTEYVLNSKYLRIFDLEKNYRTGDYKDDIEKQEWMELKQNKVEIRGLDAPLSTLLCIA